MKKQLWLVSAAAIAILAQADPAAAAFSGSPADLPVYPGSQKLPNQITKPIKRCGDEMLMTVYRSNASADAVERWYASKMPGATIVQIPGSSGNTIDGTLILIRGGAEGVTVSEDRRASSGGTVIGLTAYDPPYSDSDVALLRAAHSGDRAAQAKLKRLCSSDDQ